MAEEKNFLSYSAATFENLVNWPDADIPLMALVTELIPELCGVPYDYLLRDDPAAMAECTLLVQEYLHLDTIIAYCSISCVFTSRSQPLSFSQRKVALNTSSAQRSMPLF